MEAASFYYVPVPSEGLLIEGKAGRRTLLGLERKGLLSPMDADRYSTHDAIQSYFHRGLSSERRSVLASSVSAWLLQAGRDAETRGRLQEAIAYLGNAVAIERDRARRADGLHRLGDLRRHVGEHMGAKESYQMAIKEIDDPSTKARLHQKIAHCLEKLGDLDGADREIARGLELVPSHPSPEAAWLFYQRASIAFERQDYARALEDVERVTGWVAGIPHDPELWGWLSNLRGLIHDYDPSRFDPALAQADFREAIEAWRNIDYKRGLCMTYNNLFGAAVELGQGEEALPYLDESVRIAEALGDVPSKHTALFSKAWYLTEYRGDYEGAEGLYRDSYRLAKETGERLKVVWHYFHFANLYRRQGRYEEARESLEYFLKSSGSMLNPQNRIGALALMVRLSAACGRLDEADTYLSEADQLASSNADAGQVAWAQAVLLAHRGERDAAAASFQRAEATKSQADRGEFLLEYGRFLASLGEKTRAKEVLSRAHDELPPGRVPIAREIESTLRLL